MKRWILLTVVFLAAATSVHAMGAGGAARAKLIDSKGKRVGTAVFRETQEGVKISLQVVGLSPGIHAFHIHEVGACDPPDFKAAGGHFNPHGKQHGRRNPEGAHAGDLPNLMVKSNGTGSLEAVVQGVTLGPGADSLFGPKGTSVVIHEKWDDDMTDPAGNAGARIACGVITR